MLLLLQKNENYLLGNLHLGFLCIRNTHYNICIVASPQTKHHLSNTVPCRAPRVPPEGVLSLRHSSHLKTSGLLLRTGPQGTSGHWHLHCTCVPEASSSKTPSFLSREVTKSNVKCKVAVRPKNSTEQTTCNHVLFFGMLVNIEGKTEANKIRGKKHTPLRH